MSLIHTFINPFLYHTHRHFGFISQGKRIKTNARLFQKGWGEHLGTTKKLVSDFLAKDKHRSLGILGAGALLDVPDEILSSLDCPIYLQDANLSCIKDWNIKTGNLKNRVNSHHCLLDISGLLQSWSEKLMEHQSGSIESFLELLTSLDNTQKNNIPFIKNSTCISLNILSQLPVYWQDFVFSLLGTKHKPKTLKFHEKEILKALYPSSKALIQNHLKQLLPQKKHEKTLLLTDLKYLYCPNTIKPVLTRDSKNHYTIDYQGGTTDTPVEEQDALFSIDLEEFNKELPRNIQTRYLDSWLWHIGSNEKKSTYHQVIALEYRY